MLDELARRSQEQRIARAVNHRIRSGRPFTVDSIWGRLRDINPGDHQAWLGGHIYGLSKAKTIVEIGGRKTERGKRHSRYVPVWQAATAVEQTAS